MSNALSSYCNCYGLAIRNASRLDVATFLQATGSSNLISVSNVLRKTFVPQRRQEVGNAIAEVICCKRRWDGDEYRYLI